MDEVQIWCAKRFLSKPLEYSRHVSLLDVKSAASAWWSLMVSGRVRRVGVLAHWHPHSMEGGRAPFGPTPMGCPNTFPFQEAHAQT
jgi:hypothetical protein